MFGPYVCVTVLCSSPACNPASLVFHVVQIPVHNFSLKNSHINVSDFCHSSHNSVSLLTDIFFIFLVLAYFANVLYFLPVN